MAQRTEDSTVTSLRELMQLEQQGENEAREVTLHEQAECRRPTLEANACAEADAARRTMEIESASRESTRLARDAQELAERERADRELRVRLEVEHARRDAEQAVRLAHARRMAELEIGARRRGISWPAVVGLAALTLGATAGFGVWMRTQMQHAAAPMAAPSPQRDPSIAAIERENAALAEQIRVLHARAAAAQPPLTPAAPVSNPRTVRVRRPRVGPRADPMSGLDGPDLVTAGGN